MKSVKYLEIHIRNDGQNLYEEDPHTMKFSQQKHQKKVSANMLINIKTNSGQNSGQNSVEQSRDYDPTLRQRGSSPDRGTEY